MVLGNQARSMSNFWTVLVRKMLCGGHSVCWLSPRGDKEGDKALLDSGARLLHYTLDRKGSNPFHDFLTFLSLWKIFRSEKPDLVFASTIKPVIYGCIAAKIAKIPYIYATITGLGYAFEADNTFKKIINRLGIFLYRSAISGISGVFFQNSDDVAVFRQCGILSSQSRILMARGTGVDIGRFAPEPLPPCSCDHPIRFLLVARLLAAKGLPEFARAAGLLKQRWPHARFQLLGPTEQGPGSIGLAEIKQWQKEYGIEYLGETRDVRKYIGQSHILVLPSLREGTPTSIMEGMSMGRAAVVTDVPGCREVVKNGVNGLIVPYGNVQALAKAMEHFLLNPSELAKMGAAGRDLAVKEFDAEKVAAGIMRDMKVSA